MSQRYFLTAEATYEELRQSLNTALAYPNALGKSVFQTALYAPRDNFRRVLLAVDTDLPGYATIDAAIAPLLDSDAMEEIDEATYLAALATATGGGATFSTVTDTLTYTNFLTEAGSLADALSDIDSAIGAKADAADFDQGVKTNDSVTFYGVSVDSLLYVGGDAEFVGAVDFTDADITGLTPGDIGAAAASHAHGAITSDGKVGSTAGLVLKTGTAGAVEALAMGTAGQVLKVNSTASGLEWGQADVDVLHDTVSSTTYTGRAAPGSATSASVWKIRKTVYTSAGAVSSTATATNVKWNDRLTASYS